MHDALSIDQYFTEQIVGGPFTVDMGPSVGWREQPRRGVLVEGLRGAIRTTLLASRAAWAADPATVVAGQPLSLPGLARWRRLLLLGGGLGWSALLVGLCAWGWR